MGKSDSDETPDEDSESDVQSAFNPLVPHKQTE